MKQWILILPALFAALAPGMASAELVEAFDFTGGNPNLRIEKSLGARFEL